MKKKSLILIILPVILLLSGISIIVSILRSQQNLAPEVSKALSTDIKLVTIGDSLSVDPPGSDLYNHYPSLLKSVYNVATSDSYAVGAAQTGSSPSPFKGMRLQYSEDVAGKGYNAMIVMGGVNDVASGVQASTTEANLDWLYSQAKNAGMKVIAIPILPWGCFSTSSPAKMTITKEINTWIKGNSKVDFFIDAYGEFNDGSDCLKDTYSLDEVHINRAGHDKLALMIFNQVFQGVSPTPVYMQCGEVGCTARGDDAACGWPGSGIECKSGYNNGEGRCEIVCTGNKVKTDICTCSDATPVPTTITPTPTLSATPTPSLTPLPTPSPTPSPSPTNTVTPTPTHTPTPTPTVVITTTVPVTTAIATRTPSPSPTVYISTTVIPKTALNEGQTMIVILGVIFILCGFCLKGVLKQQTY